MFYFIFIDLTYLILSTWVSDIDYLHVRFNLVFEIEVKVRNKRKKRYAVVPNQSRSNNLFDNNFPRIYLRYILYYESLKI